MNDSDTRCEQSPPRTNNTGRNFTHNQPYDTEWQNQRTKDRRQLQNRQRQPIPSTYQQPGSYADAARPEWGERRSSNEYYATQSQQNRLPNKLSRNSYYNDQTTYIGRNARRYQDQYSISDSDVFDRGPVERQDTQLKF